MKVTRRDFFVTTAVAGVAQALPAAQEALQTAAEASARYDWIMGKWGTRFTDEQKSEIRRLLNDNEKGLAAMRAYALTNDVEPAR
jgi:predicted SpoU family rRNA methylase